MPDVKQIIDAFQELDLNSGIGLIGEAQLLNPAKRAMFIGLGGTGNHALRRLKRIIHQRYKNIDQSFAFIGIDTDSSVPEVGKDYMLLSEDEMQKIADKVDEDFFDPGKRNLMPEYIRSWLGESVRHAVRGNGAGAKRAVGRALFFNSADKIINKLTNVSQRLLRGDENANIDIFILTGISGGTGSGSLLDVAYILRGIAQKNNIKYNIHGFILMPDVNSAENIPPATRDFLRPNAFAALKEIDYWMNAQKRGDVFKQQYAPSFSVEIAQPPFDYCWPMTATNAAGVAIMDALNQTSTVAAETICAWVAYKEEGTQREGFVKSFMDNRKLMTDYFINNLHNTRPGCAWPVSFDYTACGASVAKLPISAINTYLACILFKKFNDLYNNAFDDKIAEHLSKFCDTKEIRLTPSHIEQALNTEFKTEKVSLPDLSDRKWEELFKGNDAERDYLHYLNNLTEKAEGIKLKLVEQAIGRLKTAFSQIFISSEQGPYYLNSFIQNGDQGLIALLESYKRNMIMEKGDLIKREEDLEREADEAYKNGKKSIIVMHGKHVKVYSDALRALFMNRARQKLCDVRVEMYTAIQTRLQKQVNASYQATYDVLQALNETFKRNINAFNAGVKKDVNQKEIVYSWDIFTLPEIVDMVEDTLNSSGIGDEEKTALVKNLLLSLYELIEKEMTRHSLSDLREVTLLRDKVNINKFLADFISKQFNELVSKTLRDYMDILAKRQGITLKEYLVQQFAKMERDSSPLFQKLPSNRTVMYYGTLPLNDTDIKEAWDVYSKGQENRKAYASVSGDTLVFMTVACGIPLYAASLLENAELEYLKACSVPATSASIHLVSSTDYSRQRGKANELYEWRYLPSVIPSDMRGEGSLLTEDRAREARYKRDVERLYAKGIIRDVSKSEFYYMKTGAVSFEQIDQSLFKRQAITLDVPRGELEAYRQKLLELKSYINGSAPVAPDLQGRFGIHFEINNARFEASIHDEWQNPLHEVIVLYSRSFNIQLGTAEAEAFYDKLTARLSEVEEAVSRIGDYGRIAEQVVKGFRVGIFVQDGSRWQFVDKDGDPETLARGEGVDKYPLCVLHERFAKRAGLEDEIERINDAYMQAVDNASFDKAGFDLLKAQLKKERKSLPDGMETQKYVLDAMAGFIQDIES